MVCVERYEIEWSHSGTTGPGGVDMETGSASEERGTVLVFLAEPVTASLVGFGAVAALGLGPGRPCRRTASTAASNDIGDDRARRVIRRSR